MNCVGKGKRVKYGEREAKRERDAHKLVFPLKSTRLPTRNWPFSIGDPKKS